MNVKQEGNVVVGAEFLYNSHCKVFCNLFEVDTYEKCYRKRLSRFHFKKRR